MFFCCTLFELASVIFYIKWNKAATFQEGVERSHSLERLQLFIDIVLLETDLIIYEGK